MKKHAVLSAVLSGTLLLSGCSSILQRSYSFVTPHSAAPVVESDKMTIRAESYQDVVNALLHYITQGKETGAIRLYNYPYDVEQDMEAACKEVLTEAPLGAYAVADIDYRITPIVSCYEAVVEISFRRTPQQVSQIISATGTSAIRTRLQKAMAAYQEELVLRINYLEDEEDYLDGLLKQAYFSSPQTALGFPQVEVHLYPESGPHRIAEFLFTYPASAQELTQRSQQVLQAADALLQAHQNISGDARLLAVCAQVKKQVTYLPSGGQTAYAALVESRANSTGLSLAVQLLCQKLSTPCRMVEGSLKGASHTWVIVDTQDGPRHLDLSQNQTPAFRSDSELTRAGYRWDTSSYPVCGE